MLRHDKTAPIWLFSFVDLAFLLLIAFTQIGLPTSTNTVEIVELEVPRIHGRGTPPAPDSTGPAWQLRIHPAAGSETGSAPFQLIEPGTTSPSTDQTTYVAAGELEAQLRLLRDRESRKPVLAPHRDSRSEDLLMAVSLLEDVWQSTRTVAVRPGPDVAAGSADDLR
jgi:hypothetical protein